MDNMKRIGRSIFEGVMVVIIIIIIVGLAALAATSGTENSSPSPSPKYKIICNYKDHICTREKIDG